MAKWEDMAIVGRIARPHGLRGEVIVNVETDFPEERFQPGAELFIARGDAIEPLRLTRVRFHQGRPIVSVAGIEGIDAAQPLAGLELRIPAEQLVELPAGMIYHHDLVGCRVETGAGQLVGVVTDVAGSAGASRLVVTSGDDEILVPFATEICTTIDAAGKRIVIEPPEGLLELNVTRKSGPR
ncbi:MAG: ribosome maturation factor RimM [Acidobacteriota bacterium]